MTDYQPAWKVEVDGPQVLLDSGEVVWVVAYDNQIKNASEATVGSRPFRVIRDKDDPHGAFWVDCVKSEYHDYIVEVLT